MIQNVQYDIEFKEKNFYVTVIPKKGSVSTNLDLQYWVDGEQSSDFYQYMEEVNRGRLFLIMLISILMFILICAVINSMSKK
jgi:hypothetical protein